MGRIAPHAEQHFTGSDMVRDVVIGMSDGLTVPFALAAGLSGAVQDHWLIVVAGTGDGGRLDRHGSGWLPGRPQ